MKRLLIGAVLALAAFGLAGCFAPTQQDGPPPEDQSPQAVECRNGVSNALDHLGWKATAASVACGENTTLGGGQYSYQYNTIAVFYGWPQDPGTLWFSRATAHEEGHAWDHNRLTYEQHDRFAQIMGNGQYEPERYADTFEYLTFGQPGPDGYPPPTESQRQALCGEGIVPC